MPPPTSNTLLLWIISVQCISTTFQQFIKGEEKIGFLSMVMQNLVFFSNTDSLLFELVKRTIQSSISIWDYD